MKWRKKRQKIDFRGFFFLFAIILGTVTFLITFVFFLFGKITSDHNGKQTHPDDTFHFFASFFVPFFYLFFWTAVTHFTWTL